MVNGAPAKITHYLALISLQIPRGQGKPRVVTKTPNHANSNDIHSFFSVIVQFSQQWQKATFLALKVCYAAL